MMLAGRKMADQAFAITQANLKRLRTMRDLYYAEMGSETDIDEDICRIKDRLESIKHVLNITRR
jgi:hypothetical protein